MQVREVAWLKKGQDLASKHLSRFTVRHVYHQRNLKGSFHVTHFPEFALLAVYTVVLRKLRNLRNSFEYGGVVSENAFCKREISPCVPSSKPRTTDLRPWLWGAALTGRSEHSSPRLRTGRSVVRGKCLSPPYHLLGNKPPVKNQREDSVKVAPSMFPSPRFFQNRWRQFPP